MEKCPVDKKRYFTFILSEKQINKLILEFFLEYTDKFTPNSEVFLVRFITAMVRIKEKMR